MKIQEIELNERDSKMLSDLLRIHNNGLSSNLQKDIQQYAAELMQDAIYYKYKLMRSI